jgi:hypothetical protein
VNIRAHLGVFRDGQVLFVMSGCALELAIYNQAASGRRLIFDMPRRRDNLRFVRAHGAGISGIRGVSRFPDVGFIDSDEGSHSQQITWQSRK